MPLKITVISSWCRF